MTFTNDIAVDLMNVTRILPFDLNGHSFTGDINFDTGQAGLISINSSVPGGKVVGNLSVKTGNADFFVGENVAVTGKTTIVDVKTNTFTNSGKLNTVVIKDFNGTSFDNKGVIEGDLEISAKGDVTLIGHINSVTVTKPATVIVKGSIGEFNVTVAGVVLDSGDNSVEVINIEDGATLKNPKEIDIPKTPRNDIRGNLIEQTKGQKFMEAAKTIVSYKFDEGYAPKMSNFAFNMNDGDGFNTNDNYFGATQEIMSGVPKPINGKEVAEAIVKDFYISLKKRFTPLTSKWEITNVGSEVIFTSKSDKYYDFQIDVPERENRSEIKGEFLIKQDGSAGQEGQREVNMLTIDGIVARNGQLVVTFEYGTTSIEETIEIKKGDTPVSVAGKIASAFSKLVDWDVTNRVGSKEVVFTAKDASEDKEVNISVK